tara:strand:+ start:708 stop:1172 length:465 start_codon:yes stop_codon:yes gene_type:complete
MFGIGLPEMIIIAIVALIFIGPDKLPGVLRSIGKGLVELKRATSDVRSTVQEEMQKIEEEIELKEVRESTEDFKNELGGVASKIDPLTLSKFNSEDREEVISESSDDSEKDKIQTEMVSENKESDNTNDAFEIDKKDAISKNVESFENPRAEKS